MEIEGRIIMDLGVQSGTSKAGKPWKKREMVLETFGTYPRKVKFTIFGDNRVDTMNLVQGKDYVISVDVESREFNGRWYTDVNAYAVRDYTGQQASAPQGSFGAPQGFQSQSQPSFGGAPSFTSAPEAGEDDLPF